MFQILMSNTHFRKLHLRSAPPLGLKWAVLKTRLPRARPFFVHWEHLRRALCLVQEGDESPRCGANDVDGGGLHSLGCLLDRLSTVDAHPGYVCVCVPLSLSELSKGQTLEDTLKGREQATCLPRKMSPGTRGMVKAEGLRRDHPQKTCTSQHPQKLFVGYL